MENFNTIFNQLLNFVPKNDFNQFVGQHNSNRYTKKLTAWNQFIALLYAQATGKESLRDIELSLKIHTNNWYHLGINTIAKSTLSYANNTRNYEIFEKLFYSLLKKCTNFTQKSKFRFKNPLYSLDATTIELCLGLFDWAKYMKTKGAIKMHVLLNNKLNLPEFISITDGKVGDITKARGIEDNLMKGSIITFDRGYWDYEWFKKLDTNGLFFITRIKTNTNIFEFGQHKNLTKKQVEKGVISDKKGYFASYQADEKYHKDLRVITYYDEINDKIYKFITNNFKLSAKTIADIYKNRWQIEIFFKWIKQNLKIKTFLGTSKNAVMTQIWIAMIYYLLLCYIKFQTKFKYSLLEFTRMIRETLMQRINLIDLLSLNFNKIHKIKQKEVFQTRLL